MVSRTLDEIWGWYLRPGLFLSSTTQTIALHLLNGYHRYLCGVSSSTTSPFQSFPGVKPACYFGGQSPNQHSCCVPVTLPAAQNLCSHPFSINCFSLEKQAISSPSWQHSHEEIPPPQPQPQGQSHNPSSSCIRPFPHLLGLLCSPQPITPGEPLAPFFLLQQQLFEFHPKSTLA